MKINHVARVLIVSDFLTNAGFGFFAPIFAVFVTKQIAGGSLEIVGFASAIGQLCKSILQIPIARLLDKNHGEYDDFYSMVTGSVLVTITPFMYLVASQPFHLYIIQAIFGIGLAFAVPPWYAIFTRHIDPGQENIEWSFESVAIGSSGAIAAALGGVIAQRFGFEAVFIMAGVIAMWGTIMQIRIYKDLIGKVPRGGVKPRPKI